MVQRILTLLGLAITARSIKLAPTQPPADSDHSLSPSPPVELRTRDQIVFDKMAWRPSCTDFFNYSQSSPAVSSYFRGGGLPDVKLCNEYERGPNSKSLRRRTASLEKPTQFLHVSKSAGTFMCACGNHNGENKGLPLSTSTNCHFLDEDYPQWYGKVVEKSSCESLESQYRDRGITLEGNENYLGNGGRPCARFRTALVMRSPIHRIASHVAYVSHYKPVIWEMTVRDVFEKFPFLSNNYFARSLSARPVFYAGFGELPESLYEDARRALGQFDLVFVMERELAEGLEQEFGWDCQSAKGQSSTLSNGTQQLVDHWKETWPQKDWQLLEKKNAVDARLFREAQILSFARGLRAFAAAVA